MKTSHGISTFTGTIDQLLDNTMKIDVDELESNLEYDKLVGQVMEMYDVNETEADGIIKNAMSQCIQKELDDMVEGGDINIVGYNADGEALYGLKKNTKKKKKKN